MTNKKKDVKQKRRLPYLFQCRCEESYGRRSNPHRIYGLLRPPLARLAITGLKQISFKYDSAFHLLSG